MIERTVRVIGMAGHVDHGKSALVTALTGSNPDRLKEEQERGMTIDLGFAWLRLPSGAETGIVDVPGHADFIGNMLAGVGNIEAALIVIAANEGVMPQTREHIDILRILGIERGVIALSKRDLVDDGGVKLAEERIRSALAATPFADTPLVAVSARDRTGLDELVGTLDRVLGDAPPSRDLQRPRLPIDRAFTIGGFGTVVTGTLVDGSFGVGDEILVLPGELRGRVRGLQTHRQAIETVGPGRRVAMNLSGIERTSLSRGMVVTRPGTVATTSTLAARITVLGGSSAALAHGEEVKVHLGTAEVMARVALLEGRRIEPGGTAWARLRLARPVAAAVTDRLVIRRPSPAETIGGGEIADLADTQRRRGAAAIAYLDRRSAPSPASRLGALFDVPRTAADAAALAGLDRREQATALDELVAAGELVPLGDAFLARAPAESLIHALEAACAESHARFPLRPGLPRGEARSLTGLTPKRFDALLDRAVHLGRLSSSGSAIALPGHRPLLSPEHEARWQRARAELARDPLRPPTLAQLMATHGLDQALIAALAERGEIVRAGTAAVYLPTAVAGFAHAVIDETSARGSITLARARDLCAASRKHVQELLELLDEKGVTRRRGDERILAVAADAARSRVDALYPPV